MPDALLPESALPEGQPGPHALRATTPPWYRRRVTKVTAAGVATAGLVVGGFGVYAAANDAMEPAQAIESAFENLAEEPVAVTVTSADDKDSALTLIHTDAGMQVSVDSPQGAVEAVVRTGEQRLYLRVDMDEVGAMADDPFVGPMLGGFSSVDSLISGDWVSVDVSQDSKVLAALTEGASTAADSDALTDAGAQLGASIAGIVGDLKDPAIDAITEHATVTTVATGDQPAGSEHYRVDVDLAGVQADFEDDLREALDDVVAAFDDFAEVAGDEIPGLSDGLPELRDQLSTELDKGLDQDEQTATVDFYIADGHFTKIVTDDLTLEFAATPALEDVAGAVSMDEDLVRLLPIVSGLAALGDGSF